MITVEFRAITQNGLLFYTASSATNNTHYIALELIDGRLLYHFNAGHRQVTLPLTSDNYATGEWIIVSVDLGIFDVSLICSW